MGTFIISIKLRDAGYNDFIYLEAAMENENFILVRSMAIEEREFVYYGNQHLSHINDAVKRLMASHGKKCSYMVTKDLRTERQYHKDVSSMYRQSA